MGSIARHRRLRDGLGAVAPILLTIALGLLAEGLFGGSLPRPRSEPQAAPPAPRSVPGRPALDDDDLART